MAKGSGSKLGLASALFSLGALLGAAPGSAQVLGVGGHALTNWDIQEDITWGVGARVHLSLPPTGLTLQGTYEFWGPECGTLECDLAEVGVNVLWSPPLTLLIKPYLGAGMAFQNWDRQAFEDDESPDTDTAINVLAGLILQGPSFSRFQPFVEFRYQAWNEYEDQKVIAGGILLNVF